MVSTRPKEVNATGSKWSSPHNCACENNFCPHCGLPACRPVRPLKFADGALLSTYDRDYIKKDGQRDGPCGLAGKDKILVPATGKFDATTTQRTDFPPKQAQMQGKRGPSRTPVPYRPFDGSTTYNAFHNKKPLPSKDPPKPKPLDYSPKFCGLTSYTADYPPKPLQPPGGRKQNQDPLDLPFLGNSTYRDDFTPKPIPEKVRKAPPALLPSKNDMNYTTYGKDFIPKPLEQQPKGMCCDVPSHTHSLRHSHQVSEQTMRGSMSSRLFGNNTGKLYTL